MTNNIITSWDTASSISDTADYTVATVWEVYTPTVANLIHIERTRVEFSGLINLFKDVDKKYNPSLNIIEDASSGTQLGQLLSKDFGDRIRLVKPVKTDTHIDTANAINNALEDGILSIKAGVMTDEMVEELMAFPRGRHDDLVLSIIHFYNALTSEDLTDLKVPLTPRQLRQMTRTSLSRMPTDRDDALKRKTIYRCVDGLSDSESRANRIIRNRGGGRFII